MNRPRGARSPWTSATVGHGRTGAGFLNVDRQLEVGTQLAVQVDETRHAMARELLGG